MSELRFYTGRGHAEPKAADRLPTADPTALRGPQGYRATDRTAAAVRELGVTDYAVDHPGTQRRSVVRRPPRWPRHFPRP